VRSLALARPADEHRDHPSGIRPGQATRFPSVVRHAANDGAEEFEVGSVKTFEVEVEV
jgi:hypothetical protein